MENARAYIQSHPWISFTLDLRKASPTFWMLLGEARSKSDHIAGVPLPSDVSKKLRQLYLAKGVLATTAIEGNTLTEEQVIDQLEGTLQLPKSKEYLRQEIQNILDGCHEIGKQILQGSPPNLSRDLICHFNQLVLNGLKLEDGVEAGRIRTYGVSVGTYRGAPYEDCAWLLEELCKWLNAIKLDYPPVAVALIKAILAHLYIAWIHPFGDGNGRTARLVEFCILSSAGVPSPVAHLLSNHYNETRNTYYQMLTEARKDNSDPFPFLDYALAGFIEGLKGQLHIIRDYQWDLAWRDHINELFAGKDRPSDQRRLHTVLALGEVKRSVPIAQIPFLTPILAADFVNVSSKTLSRDIQHLEELDLVQVTKDRVRAKREIVLSFLPLMRREDWMGENFAPLIVKRIMPDDIDLDRI